MSATVTFDGGFFLVALSKSSRSLASTLTPAYAVKIVSTILDFNNSYGSLLASSGFGVATEDLGETADA